MFGFVSRKEFAEGFTLLGNALDMVVEAADSFRMEVKDIKDIKQSITKLEAANNCRDGKHEWITIPTIRTAKDYVEVVSTMEQMITGIAPYLACKHCGIKKDEWEGQFYATSPYGGDEVKQEQRRINKNFSDLVDKIKTTKRVVVKQPKRKNVDKNKFTSNQIKEMKELLNKDKKVNARLSGKKGKK